MIMAIPAATHAPATIPGPTLFDIVEAVILQIAFPPSPSSEVISRRPFEERKS